jgi:hypothetical protein
VHEFKSAKFDSIKAQVLPSHMRNCRTQICGIKCCQTKCCRTKYCRNARIMLVFGGSRGASENIQKQKDPGFAWQATGQTLKKLKCVVCMSSCLHTCLDTYMSTCVHTFK